MKVRKGAASFYIVAFSTLILVIIAASFTAIVLSEMVRSANDELSQSAYDAALAGVEDAKVAFANYQECLTKNDNFTVQGIKCGEIKSMMNEPNCDMVGKILGRGSGGEVLIEESSSVNGGVENNMQQAYTCVKINTVLSSYISSIDENNMTRAVGVKLGNNVATERIEDIKISWYSTKDSKNNQKYNFANYASGKIEFPAGGNGSLVATPPVISVGIIQTGESFSLNDFTRTDGGTNRGTVFLVPVNSKTYARGSDENVYTGIWDGSRNAVTKNMIIKSNNQAVKNVPLGVYCKDETATDSDFACSAWLEVPKPAGGVRRKDETFMVTVSLPYEQPSTSFSLEFYDEAGNILALSGMQIEIDSTGRANNLYRRVLARLEASDENSVFPLYGAELLDSSGGSESLIKKPEGVISEWGI